MNRTDPSEIKSHLIKNLVILAISVIGAIILARSGILETLLFKFKVISVLGNFLSGIFYTSVITVGPAIVVLGELARNNSVFLVALIGAAGAVIGDLIIFKFIRDRITDDFVAIFEKPKIQRLAHLLRLEIFKWLLPVLGVIIIALPVPDEIGLAMMGIAKLKTGIFMAIAFTSHFLGILIVGLVAKAII